MSAWIYRAAILAACPLLTYTSISRDRTGIIIGVGTGVALVAIEIALESVSLLTTVFGLLGACASIIFMRILDLLAFNVGNEHFYELWAKFATLRYLAIGALGMVVSIRKFPELDTLDRDILASSRKRGADLKIVDTSAIIDGRIVEICEVRFLSGPLVVPRFVINELHHMADSQDDLKRARGRRGLDMLARLQENAEVRVRILDRDVPDLDEVDAKLVRLAKELGAKLITTDFNLNKVATVEGVPCLNVNDLTTVLKPVVLPGESMGVFVMKEGKEREQGVGYLDDGTMVVVESGAKHIGKRVEGTVTSITQTKAGRMVFMKFRAER
ncbi:MAG: PIN domain-containing protein [Elusimicrobia bacterium]|nr:PIN domain-containing protein [Elusimicrobiota bacterium]